ncbi:MAG TPA: peptide-methionine (S)-S-oxide reductase MsrA [Candidatus Binataceae bacterium]|nr:peptide-methionine (S)-S-oxide reductase MsrA [Candidatus Binataceae bacterium]
MLSLLGILVAGSVIARSARDDANAAGPAAKTEIATFAGGCFWCMQPAFDDVPGVISTRVGYTGGHTVNPTYRQVCTGMTGHAEALELTFDPSKISYRKLLEIFWHNIDPTVKDQQFCDDGNQYRTAIFYHGPEQEKEALASKAELEKTKPFPDPIVTEIVPAGPFYPAEDYHQQYCRIHPSSYRIYRQGCGRDIRLRELWGAAAGGH